VYSEFRQAFDYREDDWDHDAQLARIVVTTQHSGTRWLRVQLHEQPDFNPARDPIRRKHGNPIIALRAGQPFWEQKNIINSLEFTAVGTQYIEVENKTNLPMMHKYVGTLGTWTMPDPSWEGKPGKRIPGTDKRTGRNDAGRMIALPEITSNEGGFVVDLDPMELNVRDAHGTNLVGRLPVPGRYFTYLIPPHTPKTLVAVTNSKLPGNGGMVQVVMPQRWREPVGGERL
jgi:hypothetical protein